MKPLPVSISTVFLCHLFCWGFSQNILPNPGFEILISCPSTPSQISLMDGWVQPTMGTSDAFHTCTPAPNPVSIPNTGFGPKVPRTGNGMAGMGIHVNATWREYIQRELAGPLMAGQSYEVQAYISLADFSGIAISNFGFLFSDTAVSVQQTDPLMGYVPQVTNPTGNFLSAQGTNWNLVSGTFTANGTERFITIGNFDPDTALTMLVMPMGFLFSYVFIDDICLTPVGGTGCGVLPAKSLDLAARLDTRGDVNLTWVSSEPGAAEVFQILRGDSPENVSPWDLVPAESSTAGTVMTRTDFNPLSGTTWYKVVQVNGSGEEIHSDFIQVESQEAQPLIQAWRLQGDRLEIEFGQFGPGSIVVELFDGQGRRLRSREFHSPEIADGGWLSLSQLAPGVYTLLATTASGRREHRKFTWL